MSNISTVSLTGDVIFIAGFIFSYYVSSVTLFLMPVLLTFLAVKNLNIDLSNYLRTGAKLYKLRPEDIFYGVLSIIGILPSFILVIPGFIGILVTFLYTPTWLFFRILIITAFLTYSLIDGGALYGFFKMLFYLIVLLSFR